LSSPSANAVPAESSKAPPASTLINPVFIIYLPLFG
jgi:hypothetical protein